LSNDFLPDLTPRPWTSKAVQGMEAVGLYVGPGTNGLEVAVAAASSAPNRGDMLRAWKERRGGRAAPVLLVVLHDGGAALCGAAGDEPPVYPGIDRGQAERLCAEALAQPDRHAALRFLSQSLPSLETALPGINNEGLVALHELAHGSPNRGDWQQAGQRARNVVGRTGRDLLEALGFHVERIDNLTHLLRSGDRRTALAVMLDDSEIPEAGTQRFNNLSPVSYAINTADRENLPWVLMVQGNRLRLYPTAVGVGVGARGIAETYVDCQPALLSDEHLAYLWLLFSADALLPDGSLHDILENSGRFAGDLADRLRERIYNDVVPLLARGIADARNLKKPTPDDLDLTYRMALTVLFRLLFIAYAEDRDLLPYQHNEAYRRRSLKQKAQELADATLSGRPIAAGSNHWQEVSGIWEAVARGNPEWGVPAYNGGLFSSDAAHYPASAELAKVTLPNEVFEAALRALLVIETPEGRLGPVDFRSLGVREFGTIYEGLLESELSVADVDLTVDRKGSYLPAKEGQHIEVPAGRVYLHNRSGARKSSGSYYTKHFAVEHLLDRALEPALEDHFRRLDDLDETDAAEAFFDFRLADIAMGSGHFLIAAIDRIERALTSYLGRRSLPGVRRELAELHKAAEDELDKLADQYSIEDSQLLRRLIARRCIYGVDLNPLSVQLARLAVWIHTFVPGLPLSLLDHNLVQGNALVGVGTIDDIRRKFEEAGLSLFPVDADNLLGQAAQPLNRLARSADASLKDIEASRAAMEEAGLAVGQTQALCDIITALPIVGRDMEFQFDRWEQQRETVQKSSALRKARQALDGLHPLHFPVAFPEVFLRRRQGFDLIVGNPPWEKVRPETQEFWARHFPGLRGLSVSKRRAQISALEDERADLVELLSKQRKEAQSLRDLLRNIPGMNSGHPDLFRAFLWKFCQLLTKPGGRLGIVLPGEVFKIKGTYKLRENLINIFEELEISILRNRKRWVFDIHQQKSIALISGLSTNIYGDNHIKIVSESSDLDQFLYNADNEYVIINKKYLKNISDLLIIPTIKSSKDRICMDQFMRHPKLGEHELFRVRRVYADFETNRDSHRFCDLSDKESWPVYKGESFDLWQPETTEILGYANSREIQDAAQARRLRSPASSPYGQMPRDWLSTPSTHPMNKARIAFRRTTNRTNRRTLIAALIPPCVVTTEDAPWVLWLEPTHLPWLEAALIGFMASLPLDWWARRLVESKVEDEVFRSLRVPIPPGNSPLTKNLTLLAGRLACPDDRFSEWAGAVGVECGPLLADEKDDMIHELDAVVAHLFGLSEKQLVHIFETFHEGWNYEERLNPVLKHYRAWTKRL
jgi:hypothetical protein